MFKLDKDDLSEEENSLLKSAKVGMSFGDYIADHICKKHNRSTTELGQKLMKVLEEHGTHSCEGEKPGFCALYSIGALADAILQVCGNLTIQNPKGPEFEVYQHGAMYVIHQLGKSIKSQLTGFSEFLKKPTTTEVGHA